jgi:hypothetical protein
MFEDTREDELKYRARKRLRERSQHLGVGLPTSFLPCKGRLKPLRTDTQPLRAEAVCFRRDRRPVPPHRDHDWCAFCSVNRHYGSG